MIYFQSTTPKSMKLPKLVSHPEIYVVRGPNQITASRNPNFTVAIDFAPQFLHSRQPSVCVQWKSYFNRLWSR